MKTSQRYIYKFISVATLAALIACVAPVHSQTTSSQPTDTTGSKPSLVERSIKLSGEIGLFGELYSVNGREKRRPSESGRIFFKPRISILDALTLNFNFLISNEGASARQEINRFGVNPKWKWGEAQLGNFSESYSKYTINGIRIKGVGLTLSPGKLRISTLGGETQRAVSAPGSNTAFKRELYGASIGFGKKGGSGFEIIAFRARDDISSLTGMVPDTTIDTLLNDTVITQVSVTPQENIVLGITNRLSFASGKVTLKSEAAGSAHTRDRRSSELDVDDVPDVLTDIFTPKISTSADFAYSTELKLRLGKTQLKGGYEFIGPGYKSLGVASLQNDRKIASFGLQHSLRKVSFRFDGSLQNDNLIDQKLFTTKRNRFNTSVTLRPSRKFRSLVTVSLLTMNNDASDSTAEIDFTNSIVRLGQTYITGKQRGLRIINADYTLQKSKDNNPLRTGSNSDSHGAQLRAQFGVSSSVDATLTTGVKVRRRAAEDWVSTNTANLETRIKGLAQNKLRLSARLSSSFQVSDKVYAIGSRADYQLANKLSVKFDMNVTLFKSGINNEFEEYTARLTLRRVF